MASKSFRTNSAFFSKRDNPEPKEIKIITPEKTEPELVKVKIKRVDSESTEREEAGGIPEGYKLVSTETKSKRLQLLITPSLHEKLKDLSKAEGLSINEIANRAFEAYIKDYLNGGF